MASMYYTYREIDFYSKMTKISEFTYNVYLYLARYSHIVK